MNLNDPETADWIGRAQAGDKLFSYTNVNGVHVISFVRDGAMRIQPAVRGEGHACWRLINESTTRKRRVRLRAVVRSGRAAWERGGAPAQGAGELQVEAALPRRSGEDFSERFVAVAVGEEAIVTHCQKYSRQLTSGFTILPAALPAAPLSVFVSSTYQDLVAYRDTVREQIMRRDMRFRGMEIFGADPGRMTPADKIVAEVERADVYVGIFGARYGYVNGATGLSMTETELKAAEESGKPMLLYVMKDEAPVNIPDHETRPELAERLRELKERILQKYLVYRFSSVDDLGRQVYEDLGKLLPDEGKT